MWTHYNQWWQIGAITLQFVLDLVSSKRAKESWWKYLACKGSPGWQAQLGMSMWRHLQLPVHPEGRILQADNWWDKTSFHHTSLVPLHYCTSGRDSSHSQVPLKEKEKTTKNHQGNKQQSWVLPSWLPPFCFPIHTLFPTALSSFSNRGRQKWHRSVWSLLLRSSIL